MLPCKPDSIQSIKIGTTIEKLVYFVLIITNKYGSACGGRNLRLFTEPPCVCMVCAPAAPWGEP